MTAELAAFLDQVAADAARIVFLTGAGVSAASGVPTFRGPEGFWTVGSREYTPQEMATRAMFSREPETVWSWYLYRRALCHAAEVNPAHRAIAALGRALGDRVLLVTQNVDGLHLRAGSPAARTYEIHGNIDRVRCAIDCGEPLCAFPLDPRPWERGRALDSDTSAALHCRCGAWLRPHVLWFDECYDEERFRFESAQRAARDADLLVVVGTAGATNLPRIMGALALEHGAAVIDVNPEDNPFGDLAHRASRGYAARGPACELVPLIAERLGGATRA